MSSYEQRIRLDIIMQRRNLYVFLVEIVVKTIKAPLHSQLLYYVQFGALFVGRHFPIHKIHRILGVSKI